MVLLLGAGSLVYAAPLTILAEAWVIRIFLRIPTSRALLAASVMNISSGILGVAWVVFFGASIVNKISGDINSVSPSRDIQFLSFIGLITIPYLVSLIVESLILKLIEKTCPTKMVFLATLFANLLSYLGIVIVIYLLIVR